jgi:hypothetical protein
MQWKNVSKDGQRFIFSMPDWRWASAGTLRGDGPSGQRDEEEDRQGEGGQQNHSRDGRQACENAPWHHLWIDCKR